MSTTKTRTMAKRALSLLAALALVVSGFAWSGAAMAADTGHVTVKYSIDGVDTQGAQFDLYKVGSAENEEFKLDSPYSDSGVSMDFSEESGGADSLLSASTLYDYIKANGLGPAEQQGHPDENGEMTFEVEKGALYLVASDDQIEQGNNIYTARPMFIRYAENDDNVITVKPAQTTRPNDAVPVDYTVVKHWSGDSATSRPRSIRVELREDNVLRETVTLSADNDWSYSWTDNDGEGRWTCVERNVPDGYTASVTMAEEGTRFIVTNKTTSNPPNNPTNPTKPTNPSNPSKPRTGDPTTLRWALVAMGLSGAGLLIAGFRRRKED